MADGPGDEYQTLTTADGARLDRYLRSLLTWVEQARICLGDE